MNKKTIYILIAIVVILAIAIWAGSRVPAPEGEVEAPIEGVEEVEEPAEGEAVEGETVEPVKQVIEDSPLGEFDVTAPIKTDPLVKDELPEEVIKFEISTSGFSPNEFTVSAGQTVSVALTSLDTTHHLMFKDPLLENVRISLGRKETRGISFKAPTKKGDYVFYCDIPGHEKESGVMHVK